MGLARRVFSDRRLGFTWLMFWLFLYDRPERHPRVSAAELAFIRSDPPDPPARIAWISLLRHRQTWAYTGAMFLASPVWWFYVYWTPGFLANNHHITMEQMFWPLLTIFVMADAGSIVGGWFSSWLIQRGASVNVARKTTFLVCSFAAMPVASVARVESLWIAVFLIGLAAAAHTAFAANLYTIVSDTVPRKAVSSVVGIGGAASGLGMLVLSTSIGRILDWTNAEYGAKDYLIPFIVAGSAYLVATTIIHLLLPRLEPMAVNAAERPVSDTQVDN